MDVLLIVVQGLMMVGLIAVGVHYKGIAIGLFGALGVLAFVLLFKFAPGSGAVITVSLGAGRRTGRVLPRRGQKKYFTANDTAPLSLRSPASRP